MPGPITTGNIAKLLWPGVKHIFGLTYDEFKPEWPNIFTTETSDKAWEEDVAMSGTGLAPIKPQGQGISYDELKQLWVNRATHVTYGIGFIITEEALSDNQYESIAKRGSRSLAFSLRQSKEITGAAVLNNAFDSSYTFGDGKELCATDHPLGDGGTLANELATSADLSEAALEQAAIDIMAFKNARSLSISISPRKLIVPPALTFEATRILKSELQSGTGNNDINALRAAGVFPEGHAVNHYLTDTDAWFILTNCPEKLVCYERWPDKVSSAPENDFDTSNARFKATGRWSFTARDPRAIYGSPGA
jgi:hypothetical protein